MGEGFPRDVCSIYLLYANLIDADIVSILTLATALSV